MRSNLFLMSLLVPVLGFGQDVIFSGMVIDRETNEPLPNATIGVLHHSLGTAANSVGEFEFFIPARHSNDSVYVSFIGYKPFKEKISNLQKFNGKRIELQEAVTVLEEVTVKDKQLNPKSIVEDALREVPNVFPSQPYLMEAFQRSWEKLEFVDSISYPGKLLESAAVLYDVGYTGSKGRKAKEEVFVKQIRRTKLKKGWNEHGSMTDMSEEAFKYLLNENQVKYKNPVTHFFLKGLLYFPNDLIYTLENATQLDGDILYTIKAEVPNTRSFPAQYRLYISQKDMAILRLELRGKKDADLKGLPYQTVDLDHTYIYRRMQDKVYLSYARVKYTLNFIDPAKKKVTRIEDYF
ncbi:MAG: carboxypeptidase-like regulatory domain-containing protein, partial [Bacteroidota bacterium]